METALVLGTMELPAVWAPSRAGLAVRLIEQDEVPNPRGASVDDHRLIRHAHAACEKFFAEAGERPHVATGMLALSRQEGGWLAESRPAREPALAGPLAAWAAGKAPPAEGLFDDLQEQTA
jgi:sarcosine oxidase subunit beta